MEMTATTTQADERFAWTSALIDALLALRFTDAALAGAIDSAKGNEAKRKAWTELARRLQKGHGVSVPENKLRRVISKWQSQYRAWVQAVATKSAADLTLMERPPTYMPVLQRYFQEEKANVHANANATLAASIVSVPEVVQAPVPKPMKASAPPMHVSHAAPVPSLPVDQAAPPKLSAPTPLLSSTVPLLSAPAAPAIVSDEDEAMTSPESSQATKSSPSSPAAPNGDRPEMPPVKLRKISPEKRMPVPARPVRVAPTTPIELPVVTSANVVAPQHSEQLSCKMRELASKVTSRLAGVHQEQLVLQKKHFEEQLDLQRRQYDEQFAAQRKHVEAVQAVLEALGGSVCV